MTIDPSRATPAPPTGGAALTTCPKCGMTALAFICSERGCPVNGSAAYPGQDLSHRTVAPDLGGSSGGTGGQPTADASKVWRPTADAAGVYRPTAAAPNAGPAWVHPAPDSTPSIAITDKVGTIELGRTIAPAAPAAGGVAGVPTVEGLDNYEALATWLFEWRHRSKPYKEMMRVSSPDVRENWLKVAKNIAPTLAVVLARLAEPRAGAGVEQEVASDPDAPDFDPPTPALLAGKALLDSLAKPDPDALTFSPRLEMALVVASNAHHMCGEHRSDDDQPYDVVDARATEADDKLRRAIRAEVDAAPGRVDAGAVRGSLSPREIAQQILLDVLADEHQDPVAAFASYRPELDRAETLIRAALATAGGDGSAGDGWESVSTCPTEGPIWAGWDGSNLARPKVSREDADGIADWVRSFPKSAPTHWCRRQPDPAPPTVQPETAK